MKRAPGFFRRIRTRLIVVYLILTMAIFGVVVGFFYYVARDAMDREMGLRLILVAQIAAARSNAQDIVSLRPGDEESISYTDTVEALRSLLGMVAASRIYILDAENKSLLDTDDSAKIGTEYYRLATHETEIKRAFTGVTNDSAVFVGRDGRWYKSAFAPVYLGDKVAAVVGVDAGVTFFETLQGTKRSLALIALMAMVLIIAVSMFVALGVERPIARLVQSAQRLGEGDLFTQIEPTSRDEIGFLAESLDVARRRVVERDRNLQMLQRGIAHEVRNPLGGMRLFCDILSDELAGSPEKQAHVDKIRREVTGLENVVNEFLDFTRELPLSAQKVDIRGFLLELLTGYSDLEAKKIKATLNVAPETREAFFDPGLIRRALFNLINNAIQAMPGGGALGLEVKADGEWLEFAVSDTGAGIKPEAMTQLFTPFYTTKDKGTGLGMAFSRKIVERHAGTIRVDSEPGKGTRVAMRLPLDQRRMVENGQDPGYR